MMLTTRTFAGGLTTRRRVQFDAPEILTVCEGMDPSSGSIVTQPTHTVLSEWASSSETSSIGMSNQGPVIAEGGKVWTHTINEPVLVDCPEPTGDMVKLKNGVIIPTDDGLMFYEPAHNAIRPLSAKGPYDYAADAKPSVSLGPSVETVLWQYDDWSAVGIKCAASTDADKKRVTFIPSTSASAGESIATCTTSFMTTGVCWVLIDVMVNNDSQLYNEEGLFTNDRAIMPSGYSLEFSASDGVVWTVRIPRCPTSNSVHRVAICVGDGLTSKEIISVALKTDPFWRYVEGAEIALYSGGYDDTWSAPGAWAMPAIKWEDSPMYTAMSSTSAGRQPSEALNLIEDGSFSINQYTGSPKWAARSGCIWSNELGRSAGGAICLRNQLNSPSPYWVETLSGVGVSSGGSYTLTFYNADFRTMHVSDANMFSPVRFYVQLSVESDAIGEPTMYLYSPDTKNWFPATKAEADIPAYQHPLEFNTWVKTVMNFTIPPMPGNLTMKVKFSRYTDNVKRSWWLDDVSLTKTNFLTQGTTVILQVASEDGNDKTSPAATVQYCYSNMFRSSMDSKYDIQYSNPSDETVAIAADPWREPVVSIPAVVGLGAVSSVTVVAGGAGYSVDDEIELVTDTGSGCVVKVTAETGGAITHVSIVTEGSGYAVGSVQDEGGAVFSILTDGRGVADEYGSYFTGSMLFRSFTDVFGIKEYPKAVSVISADGGVSAPTDLMIQYAPVSNDTASPAKYCVVADGRVYAGALDPDESGTPTRAGIVQISSYGKPYAFPSTVDAESPAADGSEVDGFLTAGSTITGLGLRNASKLVLTDGEVVELRGDNSSQGWFPVRIIGTGVAPRSHADCYGAFVWSDGNKYIWVLAGEGAMPASKDRLSVAGSTALGAAGAGGRYVLAMRSHAFGEGSRGIVQCEVSGLCFWSNPLPCVSGVVTDGNLFYTVLTDGVNHQLVSLFTNTDDDAARVVETAHLQANQAAPGSDVYIKMVVLDMDVDSDDDVDFVVTCSTTGSRNNAQTTAVIKGNRTRSRYWHNLNLNASSVSVRIESYNHVPVSINSISIYLGEAIAR